MTTPQNFELNCPLPHAAGDKILLGHGSGGKLTSQLIEDVFLPVFGSAELDKLHDSAVLSMPTGKLAFTTDSYVVNPLFFAGGNIGKLAVCGTVNDLAMSGARPLYMSVGFILEEGFEIEKLKLIVRTMKEEADRAGIQMVTGDTKVVNRGKGDGVYVNTSGVGVVEHNALIHPTSVQPGDAILLSADIGRHGIAVMSEREGLEFETKVQSDCASLWQPIKACLDAKIDVHCLRDLTRGGLATALVEIAGQANRALQILEKKVSVEEGVRGACEILGLDPFYIANEGCFVMFLAQAEAERALSILQAHPETRHATLIGTVTEEIAGQVELQTTFGAARLLHPLMGEQLPRIC